VDDRQDVNPHTPEKDEQARRQMETKCVGQPGQKKVTLTVYQIQTLIGAHEENKALRKAYDEIRAAFDKQSARLKELEPEVETEVKYCGDCGRMLSDGKYGMVCGNPVCSRYTLVAGQDDPADIPPYGQAG